MSFGLPSSSAGALPFQKSRKIRFAWAPGNLDLDGPYPLWKCSGFTNIPGGCRLDLSYANDDIFFLEVCLFNQICRNQADLFNVEVGQDFECDLSPHGFWQLRDLLTDRH